MKPYNPDKTRFIRLRRGSSTNKTKPVFSINTTERQLGYNSNIVNTGQFYSIQLYMKHFVNDLRNGSVSFWSTRDANVDVVGRCVYVVSVEQHRIVYSTLVHGETYDYYRIYWAWQIMSKSEGIKCNQSTTDTSCW